MLTYEAFLRRETHFDGKVFVGVKTTRIYCLPSCKAKKPKRENVVFFQTREEAVRSGFRSCKICFSSLPLRQWFDRGHTVSLSAPEDFSFEECLKFLSRSPKECLHHIEGDQIYKALKVNGRHILLRISNAIGGINLEFLNPCPDKLTRVAAAEFVCEWFDLFSDMGTFYGFAKDDIVLDKLVRSFKGLPLIGIPDLFEAITWAIIGQQINLSYAYTVKRNFVARFGDKLVHGDKEYRLFPEAEEIAGSTISELVDVGLTRRKSEYIIHLSNEIAVGSISKKGLLDNGFAYSYEKLLKLRGVGDWTANYVMMRCLRYSSALPITDIGLHNAIKQLLKLNEKPAIEDIRDLFNRWEGFEAYATFYLWRSLIS